MKERPLTRLSLRSIEHPTQVFAVKKGGSGQPTAYATPVTFDASRSGGMGSTVGSGLTGGSTNSVATMSVSAPGLSSSSAGGQRISMRMEVPTGSAVGSGATVGGALGSPSDAIGNSSSALEAGRAEKARLERERIELQKHYQLAQADKKRRERLLLAQLGIELSRAQRNVRVAKVGLDESVRNLPQLTNVLQKAMLDAGTDANGLNPFVRVAQRYAGTPYVWGGESRNGFDCSGFIMVVMRDLGYKALPHSAAEQFNYGQPVARELLKPGDLVFFANTYKPGISHVGIFIGRGRFIHAAGTGKGTIVSHLSASPYSEKYAGGRRLFRSR